MGWNGYSEGLCTNGHRLTWDPQEYMFGDNNGPYRGAPKCYHCQEPVVMQILVNQTNGENQGEITEENWKKLEITPEKKETCNLGHVHVVEQGVYRIPTNTELQKLRTYYNPDEPASREYQEG